MDGNTTYYRFVNVIINLGACFMKKRLIILFIITLIIQGTVLTSASNYDNECLIVLKSWEKAQNNKDLYGYLSLFDEEMAGGIKTAVENTNSSYMAFYSIESIK